MGTSTGTAIASAVAPACWRRSQENWPGKKAVGPEENGMPAYRELLVWQRGIELTVELYGFARTLPPDERFGLCTQLQRAGVSIPANVSEGHSRRSPGPFLNHISIAIGSQAEVETLLEACRRLKFGDPARLVRCEHTAAEVGKMLYGLHASVKRSRRYGLALLYSIILAASVLWYWFPRTW